MHELHKSGVADEDLGEGLSSDSFVETLAEKNVIGSVVDLNIDRGTFSAFLMWKVPSSLGMTSDFSLAKVTF